MIVAPRFDVVIDGKRRGQFFRAYTELAAAEAAATRLRANGMRARVVVLAPRIEIPLSLQVKGRPT